MSGFLPNSRGSFVLDFIVVAMALILPVLAYSIWMVRTQRDYKRHKQIQMVLGIVLGVAVLVFELDMRIYGWRHLAEPSPYYNSWVYPSLIIHLCFAVPTLLLWIYTIVSALRQKLESAPAKQRFQHRKIGYFSAFGMFGTALTGWLFYFLAFLA